MNNYYVKHDNIYSTRSDCIISKPALVLDTEVGCVLKHGDNFNSWLTNYYNTTVNALKKHGISNGITLIQFDEYNDYFTKDEICTLLNYMTMCSSGAAGSMIYEINHLHNDDDLNKLKISLLKLHKVFRY